MDSEIVNGGASNGHTDLEAAVLQRYGNAAEEVEACLCLPVSYDKALLKVIPDEIIEKDYGCGDPSRYIRRGETVLDLGSGSGKACYIISQIVGAKGKVIGVDFNPPMLELARKYQKVHRRQTWLSQRRVSPRQDSGSQNQSRTRRPISAANTRCVRVGRSRQSRGLH